MPLEVLSPAVVTGIGALLSRVFGGSDPGGPPIPPPLPMSATAYASAAAARANPLAAIAADYGGRFGATLGGFPGQPTIAVGPPTPTTPSPPTGAGPVAPLAQLPPTGASPDQFPTSGLFGLPALLGLGSLGSSEDALRRLARAGRISERQELDELGRIARRVLGTKRKKVTTQSLERQLLRRYLGGLGPVGKILARGTIPTIILSGVAEILTRTVPDSFRVLGESYGRRAAGFPAGQRLDEIRLPPSVQRRSPIERPPTIARGATTRATPHQSIAGPQLEEISVRATRLPTPRAPTPRAPRAQAPATTTPQQQPAARSRLLQQLAPILLGALNTSVRQRAPALAQIISLSSVPTFTTPATPSTTSTTSPPFILTGSSSAGSAQRTCDCKSKRKVQRRECKERASVKWKSGRRKGQDAGSKCVVYYQ